MEEERPDQFSLPKLEGKILEFWDRNKIFEESLKRREGKKLFVFYEGPPYANGKPGIHHVEARAFKDIMVRYKTMRGFYVERKAGWDTHGLPTEMAAEKALGVKSKKEIEEKIGIEQFIKTARENAFLFKGEWEKMTRRMGYWLDMDHPYVTMTNDYIESLWWIIKEIARRGYLYEADKILPWCIRCGTALSSHELAQGYKKIKDKSIYVKFKIVDQPNTYFLAWTTTPWTLPGNSALAINPDIEYAAVEYKGEQYIVAAGLAAQLFPGAKIASRTMGSGLVGIRYQPLYEIAMDEPAKNNAFKVVAADFVSTENGTGVVHIAPAFGEDDMSVGKKNNLPILRTVNEEGKYTLDVDRWKGVSIWDANAQITEDLTERGLLWRVTDYEHDYPFCWRCDSKIIYFAKKSWWIKMSALRNELLRENSKINWFPSYLQEGRFGEWLQEVKDWAFSRERYWGTPLPVWRCASCKSAEIIGSMEELRTRAVTSRNRYIMIRHGEAESNVHNIIADSITHDVYGLTKKGTKEVAHVVAALKEKGVKPDLIISSPFLRAQQTAAMIQKGFGLGKNSIKIEEHFKEINTGIFSGKNIEKYHDHFSTFAEKLIKAPPQGESVGDVKKRMLASIYDLELAYKEKTIIIVSHEYPLWALWSAVSGKDNKETVDEQERRKYEFIATGGHEELVYQNIPRDEFGILDLHKPYIDRIEISCTACHAPMKRVSEVVDVWFDSGAMPLASRHFPFSTKNPPYPADYICEAIDQTRGWFYTLLAVGVLLGRGTPYKNVISLGLVLDSKGKKMSKSRGNVVDPWKLFDTYGADAVRWYFFTINQPWDSKLFIEADVKDASRRFFMILWNSFVFWKTYQSDKKPFKVGSEKLTINKWVMEQLGELTRSVREKLDSYDIVGAARDIEVFAVEDLSRWYIRRIRGIMRHQSPEFAETSAVLEHVLLEIAKLLAPFAPFFAEALYHNVGGKEKSVHWENFPMSKENRDQKLLNAMREARKIVSIALEARAKAGIKVRQPLALLKIKGKKNNVSGIGALIQEEVNIKRIKYDTHLAENVWIDTTATQELKAEGMMRDLVREIQSARKDAGLQPKDNVGVIIEGNAELIEVVKKNSAVIAHDINAKSIETRNCDKLKITFF